MNKERFISSAVEIRAAGDKSERAISGYTAKFKRRSRNLGGFVEQIAPGAFTKVLASKPDVRFFLNHDSNKILGRTASGTLSVWEDSVGLCFRCSLPDTTDARDLYENVRVGNISQCSFAFSLDGNDKGAQEWSECTDEDGNANVPLRTIYRVAVLQDLSAVALPAYEDTTVMIARALAEKDLYVPVPPKGVASKVLENAFIREDIERFNLMVVAGKKAIDAEIAYRDKMQLQANQAWASERRQENLREVRSADHTIKNLREQVAKCLEQIEKLEYCLYQPSHR